MTRPRLYTVERRVTFRMEARLADRLKEWADKDGIPLNTLMQRELALSLSKRSTDASSGMTQSRESDADSSCEVSSQALSSPGSPDEALSGEAFSEPTQDNQREGI